MCYAYPGPRCSGHTRAAFIRATKDYGPASPEARVAFNAWLKTPAGIKKLREMGDERLADAYAAARADSIRRYKTVKAGESGEAASQSPTVTVEPGAAVAQGYADIDPNADQGAPQRSARARAFAGAFGVELIRQFRVRTARASTRLLQQWLSTSPASVPFRREVRRELDQRKAVKQAA